MTEPTLFFTSDWHLTDRLPHARCDEDYFQTQVGKLRWIFEQVSATENAALVVAGDIFDKPRNPELITYTLISLLREYRLEDRFICLAGQHDLLQHNAGLLSHTSFGLLSQYIPTCYTDYRRLRWGNVFLELFPWGAPIIPKKKGSIVVAHSFVWSEKKEPWPGCDVEGMVEEIVAGEIFQNNGLFVYGDNHDPFIYKARSKTILNCGSLMRKSLDQHEHTPMIYAYYSDTGKIEPLYVPVSPENLLAVKLEEEKEKQKQIEEYIEQLKKGIEVSLDFEKNVRRFLKVNKVEETICKHVWSFVTPERI